MYFGIDGFVTTKVTLPYSSTYLQRGSLIHLITLFSLLNAVLILMQQFFQAHYCSERLDVPVDALDRLL